MSVRDGRLAVLLQWRGANPYKGQWALPGGFVGIDEGLNDAAQRVLSAKAGLPTQGWLEQLYTFGDPARDPRMRIIAVAYFALLPLDVLASALNGRDEQPCAWPSITPPFSARRTLIQILGTQKGADHGQQRIKLAVLLLKLAEATGVGYFQTAVAFGL